VPQNKKAVNARVGHGFAYPLLALDIRGLAADGHGHLLPHANTSNIPERFPSCLAPRSRKL